LKVESTLLLAISFAAASCVTPTEQSEQQARSCKQVGRAQFLPAVPEASGVAQADGVLWTHNDSGAPVVFRLDASGRAAAVTVAGADVRDWEDLAIARNLEGTDFLYIADIGDNRASRERITIYEVPVPAPGSTSTRAARAIHARYPDRPHDAEALLVTRKAGTFIITKDTPPRVYTFAPSQNPGETGTLKFVRTLNEKIRITGAAVSPDERWIALRSNSTLLFYAFNDFVKSGSAVDVDLRGLKEPQGEGVSFGRGGEMFLVSEGGGKGAAGMLTRIHCALLR
jgi:hypothetical protein